MSVAIQKRDFRIIDWKECSNVWDAYVNQHPRGSVFHTTWLLHAYDQTSKHESFANAVVNERDDIVALLPCVRVETIGGIASRFASRSLSFAEPLCNANEEGQSALRYLVERHDRAMASNTLFSEIRPLHSPGDERQPLESAGYELQPYLNYLVDVSQKEEALWRKASRSCRSNIRRSQGRGVHIEIENSHDGIERMYAQVQSSYARSKVPLADIRLFHEVLDRCPEGIVQVRVAYHDDRVVAAGIGLVFKKRFFAWYGGASRVRSISPFDCLTWQEIRWSCHNGLALYDFGGAGKPDEDYGPRTFKAKFGGEKVSFGRYVHVYSATRLAIAKSSFRVLRSLFSK